MATARETIVGVVGRGSNGGGTDAIRDGHVADEILAALADQGFTVFQMGETIQRLELARGDLLVFKVPTKLPQEAAARIKAMFERVAPGLKVIVLDGGSSLELLGAADLKALLNEAA